MSTWGYKLYEDDSFCEVTEAFCSKLLMGMPAEQISAQIRSEYGNGVDDHIVQLAIAEGLWRMCALPPQELDRVRKIVSSGIDDAYWSSLGASPSFLQNRSIEMQRFLVKLDTPPRPDQMWYVVKDMPLLEKGDVFWYRCKGVIYGAVVMEVQEDVSRYYLIAISERIAVTPKDTNTILHSKLYTVAWFADEDLLNRKRMHFLKPTKVGRSFINCLGLRIESGKSVSVTNCGQNFTWSHDYRTFSFNDCDMSSVLA